MPNWVLDDIHEHNIIMIKLSLQGDEYWTQVNIKEVSDISLSYSVGNQLGI